MRLRSSGLAQWMLFAVVAVGLEGCAVLGLLRDAPTGPGPVATVVPPPANTEVTLDVRGLSREPSGPDLTVVRMALDAADRRLSFLPARDRDPLDLALGLAPDDPWALPYSRGDRPPAILIAIDSHTLSFLESPRFVLLASQSEFFEIPRRPAPDHWLAPEAGTDGWLRDAQEGTFALAQRAKGPPPIEEIEEYDPWEPYNEKMFEFNRTLDRWIIKPAAKAYNFVMPETVQEMIGNGFDNIAFAPRLVNSLLQGKFRGAGRELARFLINSTAGIGGLFDIAKQEFNIRKSKEDGGQTLAVWGAGPGPYLILPFLPPLTVRDAIGFVADGAMNPLVYVLPFIWERFGMKAGDTLNERSLNLELFQGFEETTIDFYSAVRNAYLQRRLKLISE